MSKLIEYVAGFLFSPALDRVVLVPTPLHSPACHWGRDFCGHIEGDELPLAAMSREFQEENGVTGVAP
jgi:hypothetical protein